MILMSKSRSSSVGLESRFLRFGIDRAWHLRMCKNPMPMGIAEIESIRKVANITKLMI